MLKLCIMTSVSVFFDLYLYSILTKFSVYNGLGEELNSPVNILVPDAFPNKTFRVSDFKPSGLRGFLKNCLPPYTSTSRFRREQQVLVIVGALGMLYHCHFK
jgi:hypothetical protein